MTIKAKLQLESTRNWLKDVKLKALEFLYYFRPKQHRYQDGGKDEGDISDERRTKKFSSGRGAQEILEFAEGKWNFIKFEVQ